MGLAFERLQRLKNGTEPTAAPKKKARIKPVSKKREKVQREYVKLVVETLKANPNCKIGAPGCQRIANGLHHLVKRSPSNLTEKSNTIPCCQSCNLWIEENSKKAMELGYSKSKFKK